MTTSTINNLEFEYFTKEELLKYKLIKPLPGVPEYCIGIYKDKAVEFIVEDRKVCFPIDPEEHKSWFARYVFTTKDNVDIYEGEECYVVTKDNNVEWLMAVYDSVINTKENIYLYSHDKANEYRREDKKKVTFKIIQRNE